MINYYLLGGLALLQDMLQQVILLVQAAMQGDLLANQSIKLIMDAALKGDQLAMQVALLIQAVIKQMQGSRKARLGAKLEYFKCGGKKKSSKKLLLGDIITNFKNKQSLQKDIAKHLQGGWIDKNKGIWNWDSLDRMKRVSKYYRGEVDTVNGDDWKYINKYPELESFLHNVYKNSKLPKARNIISQAPQQSTNNMPKGADPNALISVVPDSANNYKEVIGVGNFKMLPKATLLSNLSSNRNAASSKQSLPNKHNYMFGANTPFENMAMKTSRRLGKEWRGDIKTWKDPNTGKTYQYVTREGINYLDNGRYWNPKTKQGGNYTWSNGWRIFGGGFHRN